MWLPIVAILVGSVLPFTIAALPMQFGQGTFTILPLVEYQCKSFAFIPPYEENNDVRVQLGLHEKDAAPTYEAAVSWVEKVMPSGFQACVATSGSISGNRIVSLQWLAFVEIRDGSGLAGIESLILWTTGTKCKEVYLIGKAFLTPPNIFVTAVHTTPKNKHDATSAWVEDINKFSFKVCLRELKNFDGVHKDVRVDWLALEDVPVGWKVPFESRVVLQNSNPPGADTKYSFCKKVTFSSQFYSPPVMITTAYHHSNALNPKNIFPKDNAITEWVEDVNIYSFIVCLKDIQPYNGHHDPIAIDYMAVGYLDPCIPVKCYYYAVCKAIGKQDARCECPESCPSFEAPVCVSNEKTYKNMCEYKKAICDERGNFTIVHNGSCKPFILRRGRVVLQLASIDVQCRMVVFKPQNFASDSQVHVQVSINYFNQTGDFVHDAAVAWAESISYMNFSACALKAGRNDRGTPDHGLTYVDYIAYQAAPKGAVAGKESLSNWWDGTTCKHVNMPKEKFASEPYVVLSAEHVVVNQKHDAATVWAEDVTKTSFKICIRELQNFDGLHKNIRVNWLAYETLPDSLLTERRDLAFANRNLPRVEDHNAYCQVLSFNKVYGVAPTVLVSACHKMEVGRLIPEYNSIASWVEYITPNNCRICIKEIHSPNGYDPVKVISLIIGEFRSPLPGATVRKSSVQLASCADALGSSFKFLPHERLLKRAATSVRPLYYR